jgi:hypothetical protein
MSYKKGRRVTPVMVADKQLRVSAQAANRRRVKHSTCVQLFSPAARVIDVRSCPLDSNCKKNHFENARGKEITAIPFKTILQ